MPVHGKRVLVTGATGNVGPHAVRQLRDAGADVHALVLPDDPHVDRLPDGITVHHGDLADPSCLRPVLEGGIDGVFLMWPFFTLDVTTVPDLLAELAPHDPHVAFVSSVGVHIGLEPVDNNCHAYIEAELERSSLRWTFLRTTGFHCNAMGFVAQLRSGDTVRFPYGAATRTSVHEGDLAAVGVTALLTDGHAGAKYLVSGPEELSQEGQLQVLAEELGRTLTWVDVEHDDARAALVGSGWPPAYADGALDYFLTLTKEPEVSSTSVQDVTGRPARSFRDWVRERVDTLR